MSSMDAVIDWPEDRLWTLHASGQPFPPGEVPILWLSNPQARNAMSPGMLAEIERAAKLFESGGRPVILAGRGEVFSSGFDLKLCRDDLGAFAELLHRLHNAIAALRKLSVPVIIAAHKAAIAGACALFGGADFVITDKNAKLGYPVARIGLSPAVSAPFLSQEVDAGHLRRMLLDPGLISGAEAFRRGLVHSVVDRPEDVLPAAKALAAELSGKSASALAATKAWLRELQSIDSQSRGEPTTGWPTRGLDVSLSTAASDEARERTAKLTFGT